MAIAYDSSSKGSFTTNPSWSHTCSGSDRILFVITGAATDNVSGVTYNGVALTQLAETTYPGAAYAGLSIWYLIAPATGANTVAVSSSGSVGAIATSYTGVAQIDAIDSFAVNNNATGTNSLTVSTTVINEDCWLVGAVSDNQGTGATGGTGTTLRQFVANGVNAGDSNGTVGTGSQSLNFTFGSNSLFRGIVAAIYPATGETLGLQVVSGTYTGDGNDNRTIATGSAFPIKLLMVKRSDAAAGVDGSFYISIRGMGDAAFRGHDNNIPSANYIQSMGTGMFQVGTAAGTNNSGTTYYYFAIGGDDTEVKVGTYTGNGSDNRGITGVGFQPEFLAVKGSDNSYGNVRFGTSGDSSQFFGDVANIANYIQSLDTDGFTVGTGNSINNNAITYYYCAIKAVSGQTYTNTYSGNSTDDRGITGVGFEPELVLVKANADRNMVMRSSANVGDSTTFVDVNKANSANAIQSLGADGFTLGTDSAVNLTGTDYYFYAIKSPSATPAASTSNLTLLGVG